MAGRIEQKPARQDHQASHDSQSRDTPDDKTTYVDSRKYDPPGTDPEGLAFDSARGVLYIADGANSEVYRVEPGPNGIFDGVPPDGDDVVTHWDTLGFGVRDPEGLTFDTDTGHLYIVGNPRTCLGHVAVDGTFIRGIDISAANARKPAGLAYAPGSLDPTRYSVYITDRGVDNNDDPLENDGKVYEFSIPALSTGNLPPLVNAGPDQVVTLPAVAHLDGSASDDGIPGPLTTTWGATAGPGQVTFGNVNALQTTASFSVPGTYTLRLVADDGQLTGTDELLVQVLGSGGEAVLDVRISARSDDAEEDIYGVVDIKSSDLELIRDKTDQTVGMRFPALSIPKGASISNAYIQFQVKAVFTASTSLIIQGESIDDASTFVTSSLNISTRPRTAAAVPWMPPVWTTVGEAGPSQRTPNLSTILQEIVNRPGWSSGQAMVFIVTGSGRRTVESFDGIASGAPLLHVEYTTTTGNRAPVAVADSYATVQGTPLQVTAPGVLGNDSDPDGDPLTAVLGATTSHGVLTLNANGGFLYTPSTGFSGTDSFTYRANDGQANSNLATVSIAVSAAEPENRPPVVTIASPANGAGFPEGTSISFSGNANDPEDGNLTAGLSWNSSRDGVIGAGGSFATAGLSVGTHVITASVQDSGGLTGQAAVTITVSAVSFNAFVTSPSGSSGYSTWAGKNNNAHLRVLVTVRNTAGLPVSGASVTARLSGPATVTSTGTTNSQGQVEIKITNAPPGTYTTLVTQVAGDGVHWDGVTPENVYVKH